MKKSLRIISTADLQKTDELSKLCHKTGEPMLVTGDGHDDLVIMSIEAYERLTRNTSISAELAVAEAELQAGAECIPWDDLNADLLCRFVDAGIADVTHGRIESVDLTFKEIEQAMDDDTI